MLMLNFVQRFFPCFINRYEQCWLPLLAEHTEFGNAKFQLVVPLDCEWIWHCHGLNPVWQVIAVVMFKHQILIAGSYSFNKMWSGCPIWKGLQENIWQNIGCFFCGVIYQRSWQETDRRDMEILLSRRTIWAWFESFCFREFWWNDF